MQMKARTRTETQVEAKQSTKHVHASFSASPHSTNILSTILAPLITAVTRRTRAWLYAAVAVAVAIFPASFIFFTRRKLD